MFQLRCDMPWCGEALVRVWWEVVVFPLLLRCRMVGAVGRCDGVGCPCKLCWVCLCSVYSIVCVEGALVYVIYVLSKLLLSGVRCQGGLVLLTMCVHRVCVHRCGVCDEIVCVGGGAFCLECLFDWRGWATVRPCVRCGQGGSACVCL